MSTMRSNLTMGILLILHLAAPIGQAQTLPAPAVDPAPVPDPGAPGPLTPPLPPPGPTNPMTPPVQPPPVLTNVYLSNNGTSIGPFGKGQLKQMIQTGRLTPETFVWIPGMATWAKASTVAELKPFLETAFNPQTFMVGVWRVQGAKVPVGAQLAVVDGTTNYMADGRYVTRAQIRTMGGGGQLPDFIDLVGNGTYRVRSTAANTITVDSDDTATFTSTQSGQSQTTQGSSSATYAIVDKNTMRDEHGNLITRAQ